MPTDKRLLKVFLCHASADKPKVRELYWRLRNDDIDAWLDAESLIPGQTWQVEIPKAIRESDVVVVCLSERSINKEGYVQREIKFALDIAEEKPEGTIFIIPVKLEECSVPERLSIYHWVDLFEESGYERLIRAFRIRAAAIGATLQIKKSPLPKNAYRSETIKKTPLEKKKAIKNKYLIGAALFVIVLIASIFVLLPWLGQVEETPTTVFTEDASISVSAVETSEQTEVPMIPSDIAAPLETEPSSSLAVEIMDVKGVPMMLVPAGDFIKGSETSERMEYLDDFYIDKYEVTNHLYSLCVSDGGCKIPAEDTVGDYVYYGNSEYDAFPVVWVNFEMANAYCQWRNAKLPTASEWEKAARGFDGYLYPWGNELDEIIRANSYGSLDGYPITSPVGSFPEGMSPFGIYDMAGNVSEWIAGGITMGNTWRYGDVFMFDENDYPQISNSSSPDLGIRCAKDATDMSLIEVPETSTVSGFELISINKVAYRGGTASAQIQTQPGTECALGFVLPSGNLSQTGGTGPDTADENGTCSWTWEIASNVTPGWGTIYIEVGADSETYPIEIK